MIVAAIVLMIVLQYLVRNTRLGKAMRAVSIDREAAAMMGVNVDQVIVFTFFVGSALAGAGGVLTGLVFTRIWHFMGFTAGLKGFTAAVLGGIGNIPGAMLGGFILGLDRNVRRRLHLIHLQRRGRFRRAGHRAADSPARAAGRAHPAEGLAHV